MVSKKIRKSKLLIEYIKFLRDYQGSSEATIDIRQRFVEPFLLSLREIGQPSKLFRLSPQIIHDYIITTATPLHRASKKHLTSSIRSFLRFAHINSYLKRDLIEAVPVITTRKLDRLPQSLSWKDVQKLLEMPDRNTPIGRRDYAVLLLLIRYGVRIGQATSLKLQDIHWQEGVLYFPGCKQGNAIHLPLYKDVADALLSYIRKDRRNTEFQELFLTIKGLARPLSKHNHYYNNIKKYFVKANITSASKGSRLIRHSFASRLVNQQVPIKIIADLLGHRWIETTFIYTKVNVSQLRQLAREWSGGEK